MAIVWRINQRIVSFLKFFLVVFNFCGRDFGRLATLFGKNPLKIAELCFPYRDTAARGDGGEGGGGGGGGYGGHIPPRARVEHVPDTKKTSNQN